MIYVVGLSEIILLMVLFLHFSVFIVMHFSVKSLFFKKLFVLLVPCCREFSVLLEERIKERSVFISSITYKG